MFNRPSRAEVDNVVFHIALDKEPISFREMEKLAKDTLPNIASNMVIRKSVWRLIGRQKLQINNQLKISIK